MVTVCDSGVLISWHTVEPQFTNLIRSWRPFVTWNVRKPKLLCYHSVLFNNIFKKPQNTMKFKRRHGEFEQGCVLSESYAVTDSLPPILPACRQPLLSACMFITRDTVCHPRLFLFGKCVREPICSRWEAFVNWGSTVYRCAPYLQVICSKTYRCYVECENGYCLSLVFHTNGTVTTS
jgi:hypothetical protein